MAAVSGAAAASDSSSGQEVEPEEGGDVPEDWRTRGLLATVSPDDTAEILRLRGLVDTRLHEAARAQDLAALRGLLDAGASPAALDWTGRTPLHFCVVDRLIEPFKLLLRVPGSADVCDASGWPLLNVALVHGWRDGARAALDAGARVDVHIDPTSCKPSLYIKANRYSVSPIKFCFSIYDLPIEIAMRSDDMELFETIMTVAKRKGVLECFNWYGKTALGIAIGASNLPAIKALLRSEASPHRVSSINQSALHLAVNHPNILKYFLDNTDVSNTLDNNEGLAPVHLAVNANNPESVRLLLDKFKNARVKTKVGQNTPLHYAAYRQCNEAAEVILEKDLRAMDEVNNQGDTPLHAAVKHNNRDLAAMLLRKGADLSTKDRNKTTVLELISSNFHDASNFLNLVFNRFIYNEKFREIKIHVNYLVLTNSNDVSQIKMLEEIVRCGLSKSLIHPLIESLLYLKWTHFAPLFYSMVIIHLIFLVSFNIVIIDLYHYKDVNCSSMNSRRTLHNTTPTSGEERTESVRLHGEAYGVFIVLTYLSICLLVLQESFFIYLKRLRYFSSVESWVKLSGLVLCVVTPPLVMLAQGQWPRHVACAALLLAWLQAMFLFSRFPHWGYYVLIFGKVIVNMFKIIATATFLVIGFSLCFMIQYHSAPPFDGPFAAFVKTLAMMSSEFDYEDLFGEDHDEELRDTKTVIRALFMIFVVFVAIVLMTFMTGMAVSDINDLNETGNIRRLEKQVELLSTFDALVYEGVLAKWLKNTFRDRRYHEKMYTVRGNKPTWNVKCRRHPKNIQQDGIQHSIRIRSLTLHNAIVNIANENDLRIDKHNKDKRCRIDTFDDGIVDRLAAADEKGEGAKQKGNDLITLQEEMKSLVSDITKMSDEIKDIKRCNEDLNIKITQLSCDILKSIKDNSTNYMRCSGNKEQLRSVELPPLPSADTQV